MSLFLYSLGMLFLFLFRSTLKPKSKLYFDIITWAIVSVIYAISTIFFWYSWVMCIDFSNSLFMMFINNYILGLISLFYFKENWKKKNQNLLKN